MENYYNFRHSIQLPIVSLVGRLVEQQLALKYCTSNIHTEQCFAGQWFFSFIL